MAAKEFRNDPRRARLEATSKPAVVAKPVPDNKPVVEPVVKKVEKKN